MKRKVTKEEILQLLKYDEDTGYLYWKLPRGSTAKAGDLAGTDTGNGIIKININGRRYHRSHLIWFLETKRWPKEIRHLDNDNSNDAISNITDTPEVRTGVIVLFESIAFGPYKNHRIAEAVDKALTLYKGILNGHK